MIIQADNNLVFDDSDARCFYEIAQLTGDSIEGNKITYGIRMAFIQCYDKKSGRVRRAMGLFDDDNARESIENIMLWGASFERVLTSFNENA